MYLVYTLDDFHRSRWFTCICSPNKNGHKNWANRKLYKIQTIFIWFAAGKKYFTYNLKARHLMEQVWIHKDCIIPQSGFNSSNPKNQSYKQQWISVWNKFLADGKLFESSTQFKFLGEILHSKVYNHNFGLTEINWQVKLLSFSVEA